MKSYILENGKPVAVDLSTPEGMEKLTNFHKDFKNKRVAQDYIYKVCISTVFLGIDHSWGDDEKPVLWETMIFGGKHDDYQERYTSVEAALAGHNLACQLVRDADYVNLPRKQKKKARKALL